MHRETTRRNFLGKSLPAAAVAMLTPQLLSAQSNQVPNAEILVGQLFDSLTDEQRSTIVLPYSSPLRLRVENNWHILNDKRVGNQFNKDQQALIRSIFRALHSRQMTDQVWLQFLSDNQSKNAQTPNQIFNSASLALFKDEDKEPFEFVFTGRHCTRRCSNLAEPMVAFGGPIFYGHAPSFYEGQKHEGNTYWFQSVQANELYKTLDKDQKKQSLQGSGRIERGLQTVELKGSTKGLKGLAASDLNKAQKKQLRKLITSLISPFRLEDQTTAASLINKQMEDLHIAYFENDDIGNDNVWDNWQLEGPNMIWYFRGNPHVHAWVHIKEA